MPRSGYCVRTVSTLLFVALLFLGCERGRPLPDAEVGRDAFTPLPDAEFERDVVAPFDGTSPDGSPDGSSDVPVDGDTRPDCGPLPDDYTPRVAMSSTDTWPMCVSDRGTYARFNTNTSTIARIDAFERIRRLLRFDPSYDPTADEFTTARMIYLEPEGLESRVSRRTDEHYPQPTNNNCTLEEVRMANPDYCAGPVKLVPILNNSFRDGQAGGNGTLPRVLAARIEAALLWFLYLSPYKESLTCTTNPPDCDSAWAYYTGGVDRQAPMQIGLARYVSSIERDTHDRIWDGILAVRCWRDLDMATPATNVTLRERARAQLDRALTRGIVAVLEQRLRAMAASRGGEQQAHFAFVKIIGPLLDRAVRERDPAAADTLRSQFQATSPDGMDVSLVVRLLEQTLPCP